jgi:oxygen-independent coproporphyrinogen-3 oxidase
MAGIYLHVPFCKKKCIYCDFYSIGTLNMIPQYPNLIQQELVLRKGFIGDVPIDTIYFGGGTPSLLSPPMVAHVLNGISKWFKISENAEITIEANPDDLNKELLLNYFSSGINRLSIGIQSFIDEELHFLGRRHNAAAAKESIELSLNAGFNNISIDLIYGLPNSSLDSWEFNLKNAFRFDIQHLSCYHLTYEEGTTLARKLYDSKIKEVDESLSLQQFELLKSISSHNGFIHYEVSNLAKDGFYSRHNTSYWQGIHYLGLGPAAHSYNGNSREWNPKSYKKWEEGVVAQKPSTQSELIDKQTLFNEFLLTRLRTIWGINLVELRESFDNFMIEQMLRSAEPYINSNKLVIKKNDNLFIPPEHFFISDRIIGDLIIVNDLF